MKRGRDIENDKFVISPSGAFRLSSEYTSSSNISSLDIVNPTPFAATLPANIGNNNNVNADINPIGRSTSCSTNNNYSNCKNNKEQDQFLPIANIGRIMKKIIPANAKIGKDAKETVQECVSEFISFITGEASDKCQWEKRKTINGDDILWAIMTLGFEDYVNPLHIYLNKYREIEGDKLNLPKRQRIEKCSQNDQNPNSVPSCMHPSMSMMSPPSSGSDDPSFLLTLSHSSLQSQQDRADGHW